MRAIIILILCLWGMGCERFDKGADEPILELDAGVSKGYSKSAGSANLYGLAAVAEMADRVHEDNWDANLESVLIEGPEVVLGP